MKIVIKHTTPPMVTSFGPMVDFDLEEIVASKCLTIKASKKGKTRVHTSLKSGEAMKSVDWEMEGFKTHPTTEQNMWTGQLYTSHYFKILKNQSHDSYQDYIKAIAKKFCEQRHLDDKIDILTINFIDHRVVWK